MRGGGLAAYYDLYIYSSTYTVNASLGSSGGIVAGSAGTLIDVSLTDTLWAGVYVGAWSPGEGLSTLRECGVTSSLDPSFIFLEQPDGTFCQLSEASCDYMYAEFE